MIKNSEENKIKKQLKLIEELKQCLSDCLSELQKEKPCTKCEFYSNEIKRCLYNSGECCITSGYSVLKKTRKFLETENTEP